LRPLKRERPAYSGDSPCCTGVFIETNFFLGCFLVRSHNPPAFVPIEHGPGLAICEKLVLEDACQERGLRFLARSEMNGSALCISKE
jgi:hypothetical protein